MADDIDNDAEVTGSEADDTPISRSSLIDLLIKRSQALGSKYAEEPKIQEAIARNEADKQKLIKSGTPDLSKMSPDQKALLQHKLLKLSPDEQEKINKNFNKLETHIEQIEKLQKVQESIQQSKFEVTNRVFARGVSQILSKTQQSADINLQKRSIISDPTSFRGVAQMSQLSSTDLEKRRGDLEKRLAVANQSIRQSAAELPKDVSGDPTDPSKPGSTGIKYINQAQEREDILRERAEVEEAQGLKKSRGEDIKGRYLKYNEIRGKIESSLGAYDAEEKVKSGKTGSLEEETATLIRSMREVKAAMDEFDKAFREGAQNQEELDSKVKDKLRAAGEQGDIVSALKKAGGGAGINKTAAIMGGIRDTIGGATDFWQYQYVQAPLQTRANEAGFAQRQNKMFTSYEKALAGDPLELLMFSTGAWKDAAAFQRQIKGTAQVGAIGSALEGQASLAAVAATTAAGVGLGSAVGSVIPGVGTAIGGVIGGTASFLTAGGMRSVANALKKGADPINEISAGQAALAGFDVVEERQRQLLELPAKFRGAATQYQAGVTMAGRYGGAQRERIQENLTDTKFMLPYMKELGISPEQATSAAAAGLQMGGKTFNEGQFRIARGMELGGFGSFEENIQRMGTLSQAGANNPQAAMGLMIEQGMIKGLNDAPSMKSLIEHSADTARNTASFSMLGLDVTGGGAKAVSRLTKAGAINPQAEVEAAANNVRTISSGLTDTSVSYTNMLRLAKIQRDTGATPIQAIAQMQSIGLPELETFKKAQADLKKGDMNSVDVKSTKNLLLEMGATNIVDKEGNIRQDRFDKLLKTQSDYIRQGMVGGTQVIAGTLDDKSQAAIDDITKRRAAGESLLEIRMKNPEYESVMGQFAAAARVSGTSSYALGSAANLDELPQPNEKQTADAKAIETAGRSRLGANVKVGEAQLEIPKIAESNKIAAALEVFNVSFPTLMQQVAKDMKAASDNFSEGNFTKFSESATNAAVNFNASSVVFGNSVNTFEGSVKLLSTEINGLRQRSDVIPVGPQKKK